MASKKRAAQRRKRGTPASVSPIGYMRALAEISELASRRGMAGAAGITFGGDRDLYEALGYDRVITAKMYRDRFRRGGLAKRVVDAYPKATWRGGAELIEDDDPEISTDFEESWIALEERIHCWTWFQRVDTLAGLGRYAGLLIGAAGELDTELPRMTSPDDVLYLAAYGEDELTVDTLVEDTTSERYGEPEFYKITRKTDKKLKSAGLKDRRVHWSRILHVADNVLDDKVHGEPRMQDVWNYLDDLDKCVGGGSEAFWLRVHQGLYFKIDKDVTLDEDTKKAMKDSANEFIHKMRRTLAFKGADVTPLGSDVSPFSTQVASIVSLISGTTGIPQRILLGSERGELASSQDQENWDTRVKERRNDFAETCVVRPFIARLVEFGALPEPEQYEVRWPEVESMTDRERADYAAALATLNEKAGGLIITAAEIRDLALRLEPLDEADLAEWDDAHQPVADPNPPDPNAPEDPNAPPSQEDTTDPNAQEDPKAEQRAARKARRVAASNRPKDRAELIALSRRRDPRSRLRYVKLLRQRDGRPA